MQPLDRASRLKDSSLERTYVPSSIAPPAKAPRVMVLSDEARTRECIIRALPHIKPGTELAEAAALYLTTGTIDFEPKRYYEDPHRGTSLWIVHEVSFVLKNLYHCSVLDVEFETQWVDHVFQAIEQYERSHSCGANSCRA